MTAKTLQSPNGLEIRGAPLASARVSKKAALAGIAVVAVILGFIIINVSKEPTKAEAEEESTGLQAAVNAGKTLTMNVPDIAAVPPKPVEVPELPVAAKREAFSGPTPAPTESSEDLARMAGTALPQFSTGEFKRSPPAAGSSRDERLESSSPPRAADGGRGAADGDPAERSDLNRQAEKLGFLQQSRRSTYLDGRLTAPISRFELKTGTVIPSVLVSEVNSDLPGEIVAQVAQSVYDTSSGNHLLIPQGTKLIGQYDSRVTFGQGRLLVSWQRLIYPDASTLELDGMGGYDREGNSGFAGRVNNHYGRIFGYALLTSVISAGYQVSQPQQNSTLTPLSNQQIAAGAVGQQMSELGAEIARRNMQVQPTIKIRKGYRLHVMVNKDVVFPGSYRP